MPIKTYIDLDMTSGGPLAADLFARAEREATNRSLSLTGDGQAGALSANLTPEMNAWLGSWVASQRSRALNMVNGAARKIRLPGNVEGFVEEIEQDAISRECKARENKVTTEFYQRNRDSIDRLKTAETEYLALRTSLGGRDALIPSKLVVYGIPAVIMIPEFFMNYSSFLKLSAVPAIAMGLSLVVALAVAMASYMTGVFLKAYHFYMRPDHDEQKARGLRLIGIAMALLFISLMAVGYARYATVLAQIEAAMVLGLTPPNVIAQTAGLLAGNLIVFAVGAAFTYMQHDENPEYASKAEKYSKLRKAMEGVRRQQLISKIEDIGRDHKRKTDELRLRYAQMRTQPDNVDIAHGIGQITSKDTEVVGLLQSYQNHLVEQIAMRDPDFCFSGPTIEEHSGAASETITLSNFAARPIHLYRSI